MTLTITQFIEALFIAIMLIFLTNPQLFHLGMVSQQHLSLFNFF